MKNNHAISLNEIYGPTTVGQSAYVERLFGRALEDFKDRRDVLLIALARAMFPRATKKIEFSESYKLTIEDIKYGVILDGAEKRLPELTCEDIEKGIHPFGGGQRLDYIGKSLMEMEISTVVHITHAPTDGNPASQIFDKPQLELVAKDEQ